MAEQSIKNNPVPLLETVNKKKKSTDNSVREGKKKLGKSQSGKRKKKLRQPQALSLVGRGSNDGPVKQKGNKKQKKNNLKKHTIPEQNPNKTNEPGSPKLVPKNSTKRRREFSRARGPLSAENRVRNKTKKQMKNKFVLFFSLSLSLSLSNKTAPRPTKKAATIRFN